MPTEDLAATAAVDADPARTERRRSAPRLPSLTGFRWWIILTTLGMKYLITSSEFCPPPGMPGTNRPVACGVLQYSFMPAITVMSGFFVLAGFVLTWTARPGEPRRRFYQARFARIYPLFALSIVVDLVIRQIHDVPWPSIPSLIANLFLVQTWTPDADVFTAVHPVVWTLCCIAFFYASFPFLHAAVVDLSTRSLRILLGALVFWPLVPMLGLYLISPEKIHDPTTLGWLLYMFPLTRISEFALGIVVALLVRQGRWVGPTVPLALALTVAGYVAGNWIMPDLGAGMPGYAQIIAPLFVVLIGALARADLTGGWSPMRGRISVALGASSFAFYLFHIFIVQNLAPYFPWRTSLQILGFIAVTAPLSILLAQVLYRWVERPAQRLLSPRRPAPRPSPDEPPRPSASAGVGAPGEAAGSAHRGRP